MELIEQLLVGNKVACSRLISFVENENEGHEEVLKELYEKSKGAYVIGVTGPPGAGKSTLTDKIVKHLLKQDKKIGVIAIDPTSPFTKGAILGDRIRMNTLSVEKNVFIRSMGTRGSLGGLSKATASAITVLDAYGCDYIIVETVGVGQSEVDIVKTADTTLMVMVPGLGDDIQAIKAGVMEIGDVFVINKADKDGAKKTFREIEAMLDFKKDWKFKPPISLAIAENNEGIDVLCENIEKHKEYLYSSGEINTKRAERNVNLLQEIIKSNISAKVSQLIDEKYLERVHDGEDPYTLSKEILDKIIIEED